MTAVVICVSLLCATVLTTFAFCISTTIAVDIVIIYPASSVTMPLTAAVAVLQANSVLQSASSRCCCCVSNERRANGKYKENASVLQMQVDEKQKQCK